MMVSLDKLIQDSKNVEKDKYTSVYPHLISYFKGKETITKDDFICGAHMVYAWMPRILTLHSGALEEAISTINKAKGVGSIQKGEIEIIQSAINNSVVGASKLLHFISPERFPIWDSKVYSYLYPDCKPYGYKVNHAQRYLEYVELIDHVVNKKGFKVMHDNVNNRLNYDVTAVRAVELVMFQNAPNSKK